MDFIIRSGKTPGADVRITEHEEEPGVVCAHVDVTYPAPTHPAPICVEWRIPCVDCYSVWSTHETYRRNINPSWSPRVQDASFTYGPPIQQVISADGRNRLTVALSDGVNPTRITMGVYEPTVFIKCAAEFFSILKTPDRAVPVASSEPVTSYHAVIRIDVRDLPYADALGDAQRFFQACGYASPTVPAAAFDALYSTWYAFHTGVTAKNVLEECRRAVGYGLKAVIVDDGWQIERGEWRPKPDAFPDMAAFVSDVHALGMKCLLWVTPPHLSKAAACYPRFRDMVLDPDGCGCFDPRYPAVRDYLCETLVGNARAWDLDGYKIDFIDFFADYRSTPEQDARRDFVSVFEAARALLKRLTDELRAFMPEFLIEFRQPYYSPAACAYASMMRVGDCAADAMENHIKGTILRQSVAGLAIHSDMLTWNTAESAEHAARQVIAALFLVPQISVRFDKTPPEHLAMLRFYLAFREWYADVLLHGELEAEDPELLYPMVSAYKDGCRIAVSHGKTVLRPAPSDTLYYINASGTRIHILRPTEDFGRVTYTAYTCTGEVSAEGALDLNAAPHEFDIPIGGMLEVRRADR